MRKFPNAMAIMLGFVLFVRILTYIIPQGRYERIQDPALDYETVVPGSFTLTEGKQLSVFQIFISIPEGIISAAELITLILLLGGCFYVIEKTGALKEGVVYMTVLLKGKEEISMIIVSLLFATGGALNGLQEEIIAMTPVLIYFGRRLGYNAYVAISISFGAAILGGAFSPVNPFSVGIALKTAGLPFPSASTFRMLVFFFAFILWVYLIIRYANKNRIKKEEEQDTDQPSISIRNLLILGLTGAAFGLMIYGILWLEWGFNEMSAEFFVLGIIVGLIGKLGFNETCEVYIKGFKELTFAVIIVGLANSITIILEKGMITDTIIYGLFTPMQYFPKSLAAVSMMVSQSILHFPVSSYSGQALMTIPILSPLADLIGLTRQVVVLAYQYGAVMMDVMIPTNGALMAILAVAGISYNNWFKFIIKPLLILFGLCAIALIVAVYAGVK